MQSLCQHFLRQNLAVNGVSRLPHVMRDSGIYLLSKLLFDLLYLVHHSCRHVNDVKNDSVAVVISLLFDLDVLLSNGLVEALHATNRLEAMLVVIPTIKNKLINTTFVNFVRTYLGKMTL